MFIFSVSSFSCSCIFLFLSSCVCLWLCGCLFLSCILLFVCFFSVCLCVDGMAAVPFTSFVFVAAGIGFLRLTFSSGHLFLTLVALPSFYHLFPSVVSHHSSKLFQFDSFLFSFCFNSSSTALTISFIRFVLIDFYGFCYLLLFASLCFFLFFFTIFTLLVVVFQFYLRLDFILTSFTFKCSREHFLLS